MGQKVNPNGFRYGIAKNHNAVWYADKNEFSKFLLEDEKIRKYLNQFTREYMIGKIEILRNQDENILIKIHSAKPGVILGEKGSNIDTLKKNIQKFTKNRNLKITIEIVTIEKPDLDAKLLAEQIAIKLENRFSFRIAQKQVIRLALAAGAKGVKTSVAGRLNGVDMARTEGYNKGEMKLHTLRQDVDYAIATAWTTYGTLGVKVWVSKGEIRLGGRKNVATKTDKV